MTYYKWLEKNDTAHGFAWPLPTLDEDGTWTPGEWVDVSDRGEMEPCSNTALHACKVRDLLRWTKGGDLFVIEFDGEVRDVGDKVCGQRARLVRRIAVTDECKHLLACDIAEDALLREREAGREPDERSWAAIAAKRAWVRGEISDDELGAARAAAVKAARAALLAAALAAAWAAAWAASWDAWAAARDAAWEAARERYGQMLLRRLGEVE